VGAVIDATAGNEAPANTITQSSGGQHQQQDSQLRSQAGVSDDAVSAFSAAANQQQQQQQKQQQPLSQLDELRMLIQQLQRPGENCMWLCGSRCADTFTLVLEPDRVPAKHARLCQTHVTCKA
jgi:hypothetical protein